MSTRPVASLPTRRYGDSCPECPTSGPSRASGSPNTLAASSNETPCLPWFADAFRVSHSNTIQYIPKSTGGSSHPPDLRIFLVQPEPHIHLAVHRRGHSEVLLRLL